MRKLKLISRVFFIAVLSSFAIGVSAHDSHGDISQVFGGVDIERGASVGDISSVNGGVDINDNANAQQISTVNGGIDLGDHVTIASAETVNGGIEAGQQLTVEDDLTTVNGGIDLNTGGQIGGSLETVNGDIELSGVTVNKNIETVNGDISLLNSTILKGDLIIHKKSRWFSGFDSDKIVIQIDPSSRVEGVIHLYRPVELKIAKDAKIGDIKYHYERK